MGKINYSRVVLGGIIGGLVAFCIDFLVNGVWLGQQWIDAVGIRPNRLSTVAFIVFMILVWSVAGVLIVWVYAAILPRFGASVRTALYAGVVPWVFGILLPGAVNVATGLISLRLESKAILATLVTVVAAALIGRALYKEAESTLAYPTAAPQATR